MISEKIEAPGETPAPEESAPAAEAPEESGGQEST